MYVYGSMGRGRVGTTVTTNVSALSNLGSALSITAYYNYYRPVIGSCLSRRRTGLSILTCTIWQLLRGYLLNLYVADAYLSLRVPELVLSNLPFLARLGGLTGDCGK